MSIDQIAVLVSLATLAFLSPGPDMAIVIRNVAVGGRRAGLATVGGIMCGYSVHIAAGAGGVGLVIANSLVLFTALKFAAAAYLVFLGVQSLRAALRPLAASVPSPTRSRRWFVQGLVSNVLNPKAALFFLSVFTVVLPPAPGLALSAQAAALAVANIAVLWLAFVLLIARPAVTRAMHAAARAVHAIFGTLLVALGARLAFAER